MDDFKISSLQESRNEWSIRLINILTPHIIEGLKSIFTESYKICIEKSLARDMQALSLDKL